MYITRIAMYKNKNKYLYRTAVLYFAHELGMEIQHRTRLYST